MSSSVQPQEERVPIGQVLFDDFFLLFLVGVALPFVLYTVWGLIDIGSTPLARPVAVSAPAASSAAPPAAAGTVAINTTMTEFKFTLAQNPVPAGKPVRFAIVNDGKVDHEFVIEKVGAVNQPLTDGGKTALVLLKPGASGYLDWTFAEAGEYQIGCHLPGHYEAGMVARLTVTKPQ